MQVDGKDVTISLVIPTIRENCFNDFVKRWSDIGLFDHIDNFIVMEDNPKKTFGINNDHLGCNVKHLSWENIDNHLEQNSWIIPRRSDTVRSYGYLVAAKSYSSDYIITLDDDCYPCSDVDGLKYDGAGFLKEHLKQFTGRSRWFNTLNSVKPRGVPFYNVGKCDKVIVNHGLWTNVLDYDAPYQLVNPIPEDFSFDNRIVPHGQYFPMCGMNVMWKSEATVLMYHLLMGRRMWSGITSEKLDKDSLVKLQLDRFGDIWCGIIMKKIADMTGHLVTTGMPYIRHERASNPFANLKKEADGIGLNETFWEHVDKFPLIPWNTFVAFPKIYRSMGVHVKSFDAGKEYEEYFTTLGEAMVLWSELF